MSEDIYSAFREVVERVKDQAKIHEVSDRLKAVSYLELAAEVESLRRHFQFLKLPAGARIALLSENRHEWIAAYVAIVSMGWTAVPMDARQTSSDWLRVLNHAEASVILVSERSLVSLSKVIDQVPTLKRVIVIDDDGEVARPYEAYSEIMERYRGIGGSAETSAVSPSATASIVYTSGTTGTPKGVMLSHSNILSNARGSMHLTWRGGIYGTILPLNHTFGLTTVLAVLLGEMSLILHPVLSPEHVFKGFEVLRPTHFVCVPAFLERVGKGIEGKMFSGSSRWKETFNRLTLGKPGDHAAFLSVVKRKIFKRVHAKLGGRLQTIVCGGAPVDPIWIRFFQTLGIHVIEGYGLTETSPIIASNRQGRCRIGSVGTPYPGAEIRIRDSNGNGIGEICVRGPMVMQGYYRNPEETGKVLSSDGWFRTGDLGKMDKHGFLHVTGRLKDLIVTPEGKNVSPEALELKIAELPYVQEVCVFGLPKNGKDSKGGEIVHAQIVPNFDKARQDGIENILRAIKQDLMLQMQILPEYMRPRSIGFSKEPFPRTSTLKIRKFQVKEDFLREMKPGVPQVERRRQEMPKQFREPLGNLVFGLLREIVSKKTDVHPTSHLTLDLGLESLAVVEFWAGLERALGVRIPEEVMRTLQEPGEIIFYLNRREDVRAKVETGMISDRRLRKGESWHDIVNDNAEEARNKAHKVLKQRRWLRPIFLGVFRFFFRHFSGLKVQGLENLPVSGPYVLAPNHECYLDNIFVSCLLPKFVRDHMAVVGAKEFFDKPVTRFIARLCRVIPVDRQNVSQSVFQVAAQVLKAGNVLLIHPEGTRSPDGRLLPLKEGACLLAEEIPCPIVPVYIEGAHEFWPKDAKFPQSRSKITVTIGEAILPCLPSREEAREEKQRAYEMTQRLTQVLVSLSLRPGESSMTSDP